MPAQNDQQKQSRTLADMPRAEVERLLKRRNAVFQRFPLVFTLLGAFGLVATFYGFEHLIDQIPLFIEHPVILLATGVVTLLFTGTLYKKLGS